MNQEKITVLLIGKGGRECAIAERIYRSPRLKKLYIAPGNAGIAAYGELKDLDIKDNQAAVKLAKELAADMVVIAADDQLAAGMVDDIEAAGIRAFGPTAAAARIESDKAYAKELMKEAGIPTPGCKVFDDYDDALNYLDGISYPTVVKANGLALGKGVYICEDRKAAENALKEIMQDKKFGTSGEKVLIEEFIKGPEVSVMAFCDGENIALLPTSRDHKKAFDGDKGPNTGGMGVVSPGIDEGPEFFDKVINKIILPCVKALKEDNAEFKGVLYPGLIMSSEGPKVLEFNSRFGDPESECVLPLLESDILDIFDAVIDGELDKMKIAFKDAASATVIYASKGYPGSYEKKQPITGLSDDGSQIANSEESPLSGFYVFHCGTERGENEFLSAGGRVLALTATGRDIDECLNKIYSEIDKCGFENGFYRKDIGKI